MDFKKLANQYKDELLDNVLPFWLENSQDHEYGGYFTCLDLKESFDTDKLSGCKVARCGCFHAYTVET